jgi:pSer/pThr/pTyr-binding forkhead associated (FHA) protein
MQIQLIGVQGPQAGQVFPLGNTPIRLGRDEGSTVVVRSPFASRLHATIELRDVGYVLIVHSANGVTVNGARVQSVYALRAGDEITIAGETFRLEVGDVSQQVDQPIEPKEPQPTDGPRNAGRTTTTTVGIRCPQCSRVLDIRLQHCPWDGALLANGQTGVGVSTPSDS